MNKFTNQEAYQDFWYFINERHRIYLRKEAGEQKPWTGDKILQQWKFCNVFRQLDKQSKWLDFYLIHYDTGYEPDLVLFNIFAFRAFNLYDTYKEFGWFENWNTKTVQEVLAKRVAENKPIISGAYMIRGFEDKPKWQSIPESLEKIWQDKEELADYILENQNLQFNWKMLVEKHYWGWGPFTCYQIVLDLMETYLLRDPTDLNTWCYLGPGAQHGIREIWPNIKKKDEIEACKRLLYESPNYLGQHVPPLNLQDIEFCLCELGKYRRIKAGGRAKERYAGT